MSGSNRIIKSRAKDSTRQLADCLHSLLVLELLSPSSALYLVSPWISNVPLIDNRYAQFRPLMPDFGRGPIALGPVLSTLAERGTAVRVVYRPSHPITMEFVSRLPASVERRPSETLHEKGLITDRFYLRGSMNFTFSGVHLNDESVELTTEPDQVALALAEAQQRWATLRS